MMIPLPPGWLCLQDCNLSGQLNQPVVVPFVLMHPDIGVALVDVSPISNPEAEAILRRRLDAARFDSIFPGFLPILHLRLDRADLPATEAILRDAFANMPPLSVPGGDGWISVVRRSLLPRDPARGTTHPGLSGDRLLRRPSRDAEPPPTPDTETDMLHREAVTARVAAKPYDVESPVPAAKSTGVLPWIIMSGVGGLIAVLALFSLINPGADTPNTGRDTAEVPAAAAPAPPATASAPAPPLSIGPPPPVPGPTASSKPPPAAVAAPPPPAAPPSSAPGSAAGASAVPTPTQRSAAPPPPDRSPRVTVRQPANLRTGPDGQASVVRIVPRGETLRVHSRTANGWVQVGDSEPRGWLHTSRLGDIE